MTIQTAPQEIDRLTAIAAGERVATAIHPDLQGIASVLEIEAFNLWYGLKQVLFDIDLSIPQGKVTALIGPSGCGKSSLLRSVNRMNDLIDIVKIEGQISLNGQKIYDRNVDVTELRRRMGMVFQKSNPFPMSIRDNVTYALQVNGERNKTVLDDACESALRASALWDEVKDRLQDSALGMSGGQQQRLCIARAIAGEPEVLLMDEPCSALDPIATAKVEELILALREQYTVLIVTHNMQQASRVSDNTAFMYLGQVVEYGPTAKMFTTPQLKETEDYITGRFG